MFELPSDYELVNMSHFPYPEGTHIEFKQSFCNLNKLNKTICSFLNSNGGYLISGVEDETCRIVGVRASIKDIDNYILSVDNIFHQKIILTNDGYTIDPGCIKVKHLKLENNIDNIDNIDNKELQDGYNRYIIIVKIIPTEGKKYKLKDGSIFYRVNASNFKVSSEKMFCLSELNYMINKTKNKMTTEYNTMFNYIKKDNEKTNKELNKLKKQIKETNDILCSKILSEKKLKERELELEKELGNRKDVGIGSVFFYNICSCFVIF